MPSSTPYTMSGQKARDEKAAAKANEAQAGAAVREHVNPVSSSTEKSMEEVQASGGLAAAAARNKARKAAVADMRK